MLRKPFILALLAPASCVSAQFASRVIEYSPAAGQLVTDPDFNDPARATGAPGMGTPGVPVTSGVVTLGGFGGSITLAFDAPVMDDPSNPMGLDAIVFGNAFYVSDNPTRRFSEAGVIEIARDDNQNGIADDPFFFIPGSALAAQALPPFEITEPVMLANVEGNSSTQTEDHWGYADRTPTQAAAPGSSESELIAFYTTPDDPFVVGISPGSGGGDAFDIAWAVDPQTGLAAGLDRFDFIRITTAVDVAAGLFGEKSTEIDAVSDVSPAQASCLADVNADGLVNGLDFGAWLSAFNAQDPSADQNLDGMINGLDFGAWLSGFNAGCDG